MKDWNNIYARPGQTLAKHAVHVSNLASEFGSKAGIAKLMRKAGFLHDLGKVSKEFRAYMECIIAGHNVIRGRVQHSIYGAVKAYQETIQASFAAEILGNIIASHHGRLQDYLSPDGETPFAKKITAELGLTEELEIPANHPNIKIDMLEKEVLSAIEKTDLEDRAFSITMLIKYAYSCLVDADRLDAYYSQAGGSYLTKVPDWNILGIRLEQQLKALEAVPCHSEMRKLRKQVSEECRKSGDRDIGIYKLEVPTGGGKTLSSLRFALAHAKKHRLDRIIYVIPYLSVLNQVANEIRTSLEVDNQFVLEHHSAFLPDNEKYYRLQIDRWDSPIILTTQVQFMESVMSDKGSDLRKFHNMSQSVIIFDEAQSLPIKCVHIFNGIVNFLYRQCNSTILLCTATQPLLDQVDRPIHFSQAPAIATYIKAPERYCIIDALKPTGYTCLEIVRFVLEKHQRSTLVILNTKTAAKAVYGGLKKEGVPVVHLSTNMCSAHRNQVINKLLKRLAQGSQEPVICVSTQLIEAGIDMSFECVIRDLAGLDSIYQAAGRCNRHGEFDGTKDVYVINIANDNLKHLEDIEIGAEISKRLFNDQRAGQDNNRIDMNTYYQYYYFERKNCMDYPLPSDRSIYDLLTVNLAGQIAYKSRKDKEKITPPAILCAIRSAAEAFCVIAKGRTEVVVPYGKGEKLALQFAQTDDLAVKRSLLHKLGSYSVSLYRYQLERLQECDAIDDQNYGGLIVLKDGYYHSECGID